MRKTKKAVASLAIAGMVLSMAPMSVFGATTDSNRLAGAGRVETAIAVANQGWANGSDSVIVVPADDANIVDALAAAPLAGQLKAPILVTYKDALDPQVQQKIKDLGAKNVYAVGALSADTVASLKAISGVTVTALQGADRTDTAAKVAAQLTNVKGSFVVAYNGTADALSAASFAAANGYSIVVSNPDGTIPASEKVTAPVYTVGGQAKYDGATKLAGADRYATNDAVNNGLTFKYDKVYVANGESLVDALAGAPLAAQTNSPIVLADATKAATGVNDNLSDSSKVIALGGVGAVSDAVLGQVNKSNTGVVSVSSVKAISANSIKVTFTNAPADTSKVTFAVDNTGTPVTTTVAWNEAKTEATLQASYNYAPGTYTVAVKNDTVDLGKSTVEFTQQAAKKINITSDVLSVVPMGSATNPGVGFATYTVEDQYGNDITSTPLGNNIKWTTGIGQVNTALTKNGVIAIDPLGGIPLTQYTSAVINGYHQDSYVSTSASLSVSMSAGTLSKVTLNKLTSPNNDDFNAGNSSGRWYIDYTALDASGNPTSDYTLVNSGILSINGGAFLNVTIDRDPANNNKAVFAVELNPTYTNNLVADMQIPITVLTTSGQSASLNVTLKKAQEVDVFTLTPPAQMVASQETVTIPYTARDAQGNAITDFAKLDGKVNLTISGGGTIDLVRNADGTASVQAKMPAAPANGSLTVYVQASVISNGKYNQMTLNVQQPKKPDVLTVDNTAVVQFMQNGSSQTIDFGFDNGGLKLLDQYGRAMDITNQSTLVDYYYVEAARTSGTAVSVTQTKGAYNNKAITINADSEGSATITYEVFKDVAGVKTPTGISKSVSYTVVKDKDIVDYTLDQIATPIRALDSAKVAAGATADFNDVKGANYNYSDYAADTKIYGKTSGGAKVALNTAKIAAVSIDNATDFALFNPADGTVASATLTNPAVDEFSVYAYDFANPTKTSATGNLAVTVIDSTGNYKNVTTALKSTTDSPVVSKVEFATSRSSGTSGLSVSGSTVTVDLTAAGALSNVQNKVLTKYAADGSYANRSSIYFRASDQFGTTAAPISLVSITNSELATGVTASIDYTIPGTPVLKIQKAGVDAVVADIDNGDSITLSALTANGQIASVKIVFQK